MTIYNTKPYGYIASMEFFDKTREWSRTRKRILALKKRGWSQVKIAESLGKHPQFVNRVIKQSLKSNDRV